MVDYVVDVDVVVDGVVDVVVGWDDSVDGDVVDDAVDVDVDVVVDDVVDVVVEWDDDADDDAVDVVVDDDVVDGDDVLLPTSESMAGSRLLDIVLTTIAREQRAERRTEEEGMMFGKWFQYTTNGTHVRGVPE